MAPPPPPLSQTYARTHPSTPFTHIQRNTHVLVWFWYLAWLSLLLCPSALCWLCLCISSLCRYGWRGKYIVHEWRWHSIVDELFMIHVNAHLWFEYAENEGSQFLRIHFVVILVIVQIALYWYFLKLDQCLEYFTGCRSIMKSQYA